MHAWRARHPPAPGSAVLGAVRGIARAAVLAGQLKQGARLVGEGISAAGDAAAAVGRKLGYYTTAYKRHIVYGEPYGNSANLKRGWDPDNSAKRPATYASTPFGWGTAKGAGARTSYYGKRNWFVRPSSWQQRRRQQLKHSFPRRSARRTYRRRARISGASASKYKTTTRRAACTYCRS